jgi:hypothetical protein
MWRRVREQGTLHGIDAGREATGAMTREKDVGATALLDQLNDLDARELAWQQWRPSWRWRAWNIGLIAFSLGGLTRGGVSILPATVLAVLYLMAAELLPPMIMSRRLGKKRQRVLDLHDEMERLAEQSRTDPGVGAG